MWRRLRAWWYRIMLWLLATEPTYTTVVNLEKDRALPGKARRRARRAA